jgi:hypothetical protein
MITANLEPRWRLISLSLVVLAAIAVYTPNVAGATTQGSWPGANGPVAANSQYGYPYPHAPACTDGGACVADAWSFFQGQCTPWVAYRLNQLNGMGFNNNYGGLHWGNAEDWGATATALGIPVNGTPAVGSVAERVGQHVLWRVKFCEASLRLGQTGGPRPVRGCYVFGWLCRTGPAVAGGTPTR